MVKNGYPACKTSWRGCETSHGILEPDSQRLCVNHTVPEEDGSEAKDCFNFVRNWLWSVRLSRGFVSCLELYSPLLAIPILEASWLEGSGEETPRTT